MDDVISFTLKEIGGVSILLTVLSSWIGSIWKNRIHLKEKHQFDLKVKDLEIVHTRQTQLLEHELQIERHSAQLGHAKLIEKRVRLIDENYKLLVELHELIHDTISPDVFDREKPSKQETYDSALPKFDAFNKHFERNKIYFSKNVTNKVSDFTKAAIYTLNKTKLDIASGVVSAPTGTVSLQELFGGTYMDIVKARIAIEQDFKNILKVNEA